VQPPDVRVNQDRVRASERRASESAFVGSTEFQKGRCIEMKKLMIVVTVLFLAVPLAAQEADPPPIVEAAHNRVESFLGLSEEQAADWDAIYQIHRDAEQPLKDEITAVQAEIDALFEAGDPDPAEVGALVIERRQLGEDLIEVHVVYHEGFVALLDEAQLRRLKFIARADEVQQIIPAFKLFELIPRR
jgi:Spy/CpxP family protein refolding chaperone